MNPKTNPSCWRAAVMFAGVATGVILAGFAFRLLFSNQVLLGPPDSRASNAGASWILDAKGGGFASVDFSAPATCGGCDFVLGNTSNFVAGVENYASCRCPLFSLGPAAGGARPMTFSFAYQLDDPVADGNNLRVQLRFWDAAGKFTGEQDVLVGAHTGESAMTRHRTFSLAGILAPEKSRTVDIAIYANTTRDQPWVSGTGRFGNLSLMTTAHGVLFRALVSTMGLVGLGALIVMLAHFWRRSAPAPQ